MWKLPPKAKIFEALSAVGDGRVKVTGETNAEVTSSSLDKTYHVEWNEDFTRVTSNDNASHWQGYLGYPILAVLMEKGKLAYDKAVAGDLAGIPWKVVNKRFKNDYDKAIESVLGSLKDKGVDTGAVRDEVERIMKQIEQLSLEKLAG
ncbi:MAG TPA: hypothetical protein VMU10_11795 [Desulfomonilia bacterium]|nr:hypothetical protein [Desulfomonilia bacterium]